MKYIYKIAYLMLVSVTIINVKAAGIAGGMDSSLHAHGGAGGAGGALSAASTRVRGEPSFDERQRGIIDLLSTGKANMKTELRLQPGLRNLLWDNHKNDTRCLPLKPLELASVNGDANALKAFLAAGIDVPNLGYDLKCLLLSAAGDGHVDFVMALLALGVSPKIHDDDSFAGKGRTPLHYLVKEGPMEVIAALLAAGADVNAQTEVGWIPLAYLDSETDMDATRLLLDAGSRATMVPESILSKLKTAGLIISYLPGKRRNAAVMACYSGVWNEFAYI